MRKNAKEFLTEFYYQFDEKAKGFKNCCEKGCSYCCHQAIEILSIEHVLIESYIEKSIRGTSLIKIKENLNNWLDYFEANTPSKEVLTIKDVFEDFRLKIGDDKVPCPFLINGLCAIYPVRPLTCRAHFMQSSSLECQIDCLTEACYDSQSLRKVGLKYLTQYSNSKIEFLPFSVMKTLGIERQTKKMETIEI